MCRFHLSLCRFLLTQRQIESMMLTSGLRGGCGRAPSSSCGSQKVVYDSGWMFGADQMPFWWYWLTFRTLKHWTFQTFIYSDAIIMISALSFNCVQTNGAKFLNWISHNSESQSQEHTYCSLCRGSRSQRLVNKPEISHIKSDSLSLSSCLLNSQ